MTRRFLALTALVPVLLLGACTGSDDEPSPDPTDSATTSAEPTDPGTPSDTAATGDDPEAAVRDYLTALYEGDCEAVKGVAATPDEVDCATIADQKPVADPADATITLAAQEGDSGVVVVVWEGESIPELTYQVQQADGAWKVQLSPL